MDILTVTLPLVLVIDPFGNLPFVIAVFGRLDGRRYVRAVTREILIAVVVLLLFSVFGRSLLTWLGIDQASLRIAGGTVLFMIAIKMVFGAAAEVFHRDEMIGDDPIAVPVAIPAVAGPSAIATILFMASLDDVSRWTLMGAIAVSGALTWAVFASGRFIAGWLGIRGQVALEKLTGMFLSILAVDLVLDGIRDILPVAR